MLEIAYGFKSEMVRRADNRSLLEAIATSNIRVGVMIPLHRYKNTYLDRWLFRSAIVARYTFIGFVKKLLRDKSVEDRAEPEVPSVYDILMSSRDGEGLSPLEIAAESTNLILAGEATGSLRPNNTPPFL